MTTPDDAPNPVLRAGKIVVGLYVIFCLLVMSYTNCVGFPEMSPWDDGAATAGRAAAEPPAETPATATETDGEAPAATPEGTPAPATPAPEPAVAPAADHVPGVAFVDALLYVYDNAVAKPTVGWLPNDRVYPTIFLDNVENFQLGARDALLYATRVMRDELTRMRTTDKIDDDVAEAYEQFSLDPKEFWLLPPAEREYKKAAEALRRYRQRLLDGEAKFYPRADNLDYLLDQMNSILGGTNNQLLNTIPDLRTRLSEETAGDSTLSGEKLVDIETKWTQTDDSFYRARGVAFVYREVMKAALVDFEEVLATWKATETAETIVRDFLDYAQFDPLYVANGSLGSMWPNHPYQLLGLLSQARERARSLRSIVTSGSTGS